MALRRKPTTCADAAPFELPSAARRRFGSDLIDTIDTTRMRKESLAAIDELKQRGPTSKRQLSGWSQVGAGALSLGCVVAAANGQIELGIPCVIGGAAYSAGMQYISH